MQNNNHAMPWLDSQIKAKQQQQQQQAYSPAYSVQQPIVYSPVAATPPLYFANNIQNSSNTTTTTTSPSTIPIYQPNTNISSSISQQPLLSYQQQQQQQPYQASNAIPTTTIPSIPTTTLSTSTQQIQQELVVVPKASIVDHQKQQEQQQLVSFEPLFSQSNVSSTTRSNLNATIVEQFPIEIEQVDMQNVMKGGQAQVYHAKYRMDDDVPVIDVAVKMFYSQSKSDQKTIIEEVSQLETLHHPNILRIIRYYISYNILVTKWMAHGTLEHYIEKYHPISQHLALKWARQIAQALAYAHAKQVNHLDLKPLNILLDKDDNAVIADFGMSKSVDSSKLTAQFKGTVCYLAPEMIEAHKQSALNPTAPIAKIHKDYPDMYAYGLIVYYMLSGKHAFQNDNIFAIMLSILNPEAKPTLDSSWDAKLRDIITKCWDNNPSTRYTAKEVVDILQ